VLCSAMVVIPLVTALIGVGQTYLTTRVGNGVMADLRERLFEHLERMELAFFTATKTGSIQSRLANDVGGVGTVLTSTASSILANSVTVIASLVAMLVLSWQLSIIALALMPVFIVIQRKVGRRRRAGPLSHRERPAGRPPGPPGDDRPGLLRHRGRVHVGHPSSRLPGGGDARADHPRGRAPALDDPARRLARRDRRRNRRGA